MIDIADQHYDLDITRARQVLGWEPLRRLRATLPLMVQALMRDPLRWYRENGLRAPRWLRRSTG
jgi:nucleoside-diphosphate-sugar epimerase